MLPSASVRQHNGFNIRIVKVFNRLTRAGPGQWPTANARHPRQASPPSCHAPESTGCYSSSSSCSSFSVSFSMAVLMEPASALLELKLRATSSCCCACTHGGVRSGARHSKCVQHSSNHAPEPLHPLHMQPCPPHPSVSTLRPSHPLQIPELLVRPAHLEGHRGLCR